LISGIGALIFVILVGICLCKKNKKFSYSHRKIDGENSKDTDMESTPLNLGIGSMNAV